MDQNPQTKTPETLEPQDLSAKWTRIPMKGIRDPPQTPGGKQAPISPDSVVLMDDYLIIITRDKNCDETKSSRKRNARLLAVDLRDLSVQQIRVDKWGETCPKYWGWYDPKYLMQKYNENQIIIFDVSPAECYSNKYRCSHMLTVESFRPLSVKCKPLDIQRDREKEFKEKEVRISQECFYFTDTYANSDLWCFEPKNQTWKACKTSGRDHVIEFALGESSKCLVFKDNLYAYDYYSNISKLNFETMKWKDCHEKFEYSSGIRIRLMGDIYNDHLVLLHRDINTMYQEGKNQLRCWNFEANSWKIFNVPPPGPYHCVSKLIVYKNSLWLVGGSEEGDIYLMTSNLDNLGLEALKSHEGQHFKALFMNETESDVKFKVQGKIIPAHKEVLMKKSKFFAGMFRSGMAETKQDVIEMNDCDFDTFQEFLRFLYCDEIKPDDELVVFRLIEFADKYVQDNLKDKCFFYLKLNINAKTVFKIFDEALKKNFQNLVAWCINHLRANITLANIVEIVQSEIPDHSRELNDEVLNWIRNNYFKIYQKRTECLRFCEEFLTKNVKKETIVKIGEFVAGEEGRMGFEKGVFEQETKKLREKVYSFMQENWEEMNQEETEKAFPRKLFRDMLSYFFKTSNLGEKKEKSQELQEIKQDDSGEKVKKNGEKKGRKRKEPVQKEDDGPAEKPELKKTKK